MKKQKNHIVFNELKAILAQRLVWYTLANQDIKLRYRRSYLGPFWLTISMMVSIYTMGFLYSHLFKANIDTYFPYLASGVICWTFLSTLILESANIFIESEGYIRNSKTHLSIFNMRLIVRNFFIFLHNLVAFVPIIFIFHTKINFWTFIMPFSIIIIAMNAVFWGAILGIIGARYRDFSQILTSLVQVIFFLTPIMWMPSYLPEKAHWVIQWNPFYHFLNLLRCPLIGEAIPIFDLLVAGAFTLLGFFTYQFFIRKYKDKVVFWL